MMMKKMLLTGVALVAVTAQAQPAEAVIYPAKGQSTAQQEKDRDECMLWSRKQSGYETTPSSVAQPAAAASSAALPATPTAQRSAQLPALPGLPTPPSLPSPPDAQAKAAVDAVVQQIHQQQRELQQAGGGAREGQQAVYARALAACMDGRGYSVR